MVFPWFCLSMNPESTRSSDAARDAARDASECEEVVVTINDGKVGTETMVPSLKLYPEKYGKSVGTMEVLTFLWT